MDTTFSFPRRRRMFSIMTAAALVVTVAPALSFAEAPDTAPDHKLTTTPQERYRVETVAEGLEIPWAMAFAPDRRLFVTERPGRLRIIENGKLLPEPVAGLEDVNAEGEIGLMSIAFHPDFQTNHQLYLSHGYVNGGSRFVRISRYREENGRLTEKKVIMDGIPARPMHAGCRLAFATDRMLYITTGDAGTSPSAQKLDSLLGKTLRLDPEGKVPADNPFAGREGIRPEIFTYGHRNGQGLALEPGSGRLFEAEHGPSDWDAPGGGDEVNVLEAGKDYGWPAIHHRETRNGMVSPWSEWSPAVAPGGIAFYNSPAMPEWQGNLFVACLKGECLLRVSVKDGRPSTEERLFEKQYGRIREVTAGPDGALYFATSNRDNYGQPRPGGDRILRVVPAQAH